jgi:flagellar FliL protein
MSDNTTTAPAPPKKKSGLLKWIVISVLVLLVLGGGGGAAWWFWFRTPPPAEEGAAEAHKAEAAPEGEGIIPMEQFLVNLADTGAQRFVRVTLRLVVAEEAEAAAIEKNEVKKARLRSTILELLTQQTASVLVTVEGKEQLKKMIAERTSKVLGETKVLDVLFTDFVVQF